MVYIHLHVASWALGVLLFFAAWFNYSKGKVKVADIMRNINRIVYLVILFSGIMLLYRYTQAPVWSDFGVEAVVKGLAGIWLIIVMELFLHRYRQNSATKALLIQFFLIFAIVLILGFGRLPWGFLP